MPVGGVVLRWSEVVKQSRGGVVGMVRGGRTASGVGRGELIGPGNGQEGCWAGRCTAWFPHVLKIKL